MGILDKVAKLEKRIERLAARGDVAPEPVEVRKGILDEVEELVQPGPRSRPVFPYTRVAVALLAADARARAALQAVLGDDEELRAAIVERLREAGCGRLNDLAVRTRFVRKAGAEWVPGRTFRVTCEREDIGSREPVPAPAPALAQLVIVKGSGTRKMYPLTAERTNIGRVAEVLDKERRVVRRNQVVFTEGADAANDTVSRAQAHIVRTSAGEHRLFDDRSSHGTRIFRQGRTIDLPSGSPRGVKLLPGDEVYFGQACARFEQKGN